MVTDNRQVREIVVAKLDDIPPGGMLPITVDKRPLLLCRLEDRVFAVGAICPHRGAPLAEGRLHGALLRCPWHGISFDIRTGHRICAPECADLKVYTVTVKEKCVWLALPDTQGVVK